MNATDLIHYLDNADAEMTVIGNELKIRVDKHVMTTDVIENIKSCKYEILNQLTAANQERSVNYVETITNVGPEIPGYVQIKNYEMAETLIDSLSLRDDRVFIRKCLNGICGTNRLDIVGSYLDQWQQGEERQPLNHRKENAGRYRANVWLRGVTNFDA